jgi:FkbM family methyltransferase
MTPLLKIRSFTNDQYVLDKVFYSNFYRMNGFKENEKKPIVMDLGAHAGYFSFLALSLGAKKVYAFEPFTPNYQMLLENIGNVPFGQTIPYQLGVYVSEVCLTFNFPDLTNGVYFDFSNIGLDRNPSNPQFCKCCMIPLDTLLQQYVGETVDLMKISIGYAEMNILSMSSQIETMVDNICGEIALDDAGQTRFKTLLENKGFKDVAFYPTQGEEGKILFHASKRAREEMFN